MNIICRVSDLLFSGTSLREHITLLGATCSEVVAPRGGGGMLLVKSHYD